MAEVKPFRAERYDEANAGPLEQLVAPPYDVISPEERTTYLGRSPYNVVHLTLPDDEQQAGRELEEWRKRGVLVRDDQLSFWFLSQDYTVIADGHHRYETALAYAAEGGSPYLMVVLVPTRQEGLTIFPTHRVVERLGDVNGTEPVEGIGDALQQLDELPRDRPAVALYRDGETRVLKGNEPLLDAAFVESFAPEGVSYTPRVEDAVGAVDSGRAAAAFLLRPPTIEQVRAVAERGETMPQKSTYFYPKLTSGLLFHPLD